VCVIWFGYVRRAVEIAVHAFEVSTAGYARIPSLWFVVDFCIKQNVQLAVRRAAVVQLVYATSQRKIEVIPFWLNSIVFTSSVILLVSQHIVQQIRNPSQKVEFGYWWPRDGRCGSHLDACPLHALVLSTLPFHCRGTRGPHHARVSSISPAAATSTTVGYGSGRINCVKLNETMDHPRLKSAPDCFYAVGIVLSDGLADYSMLRWQNLSLLIFNLFV